MPDLRANLKVLEDKIVSLELQSKILENQLRPKLMHKTDKIAIGIFAFISIVFASSIFINFGYWGGNDWDSQFFINAVPRATILEYHQFPLWNPYYCGGNVMLGSPWNEFLSPMYVLIMVFGVVKGMKMQIIIHLFLGMLGMYYLSKHLKLEKYSSFLPPFVFMLSSVYPLRMVAGHNHWWAIAWIPWSFLYYLKSLESGDRKSTVISSLFLCLIFLESLSHVFLLVSIFFFVYSASKTVQLENARPLKILSKIFLLVFIIGAVKFIPFIEFLNATDISLEAETGEQPSGFKVLGESLLSRTQVNKLENVIFYTDNNFPWSWHEYGAYIGLIPLILFIFGSAAFFKKQLTLIITSIIFLILSLGSSSPINLWAVLSSMPVYNSIHGPSRFLVIFVFCASLLAGIALSELEKKRKIFTLFIVLFVLTDLILVNFPIFGKAFTVRPPEINASKSEFRQIITPDMYFDHYTNFLNNLGTVNCYERLHPPIRVIPADHRNYLGEAFLVFETGDAEIGYFSPNKVVVDVDIPGDDILVLNQNLFKGWKVEGKEVESFQGLISTRVSPADTQVTFYYLPASFLISRIISGIAIIFFIFLWIRAEEEK